MTTPLSQADYDTLHTTARALFDMLYAQDVHALSPAQRQVHQKELSDAYLAMVTLENHQFASLGERNKAALAALQPDVLALQACLNGKEDGADWWAIARKGVQVLAAVAKVV